jgi:AcrR family transcriptional regulator
MRIHRDSSNHEANGPNDSASSASVRDRVLRAACELFAETGFHGTHLREICLIAGTNVAGVCYHFDSKEGLYQAVMMEAGRQLSDLDLSFVSARHLSAEKKLLALIESLLQRLGSKRAWIAKLLARELVDCASKDRSYAASRLEQDSILLQAAMRKLGAVNSEAIRLHAITLIAECVFYSLTEVNQHHPLNQLANIPSMGTLAQFLAQRSTKAIQSESAQREVTNP